MLTSLVPLTQQQVVEIIELINRASVKGSEAESVVALKQTLTAPFQPKPEEAIEEATDGGE